MPEIISPESIIKAIETCKEKGVLKNLFDSHSVEEIVEMTYRDFGYTEEQIESLKKNGLI